jgi:hypothetical protein
VAGSGKVRIIPHRAAGADRRSHSARETAEESATRVVSTCALRILLGLRVMRRIFLRPRVVLGIFLGLRVVLRVFLRLRGVLRILLRLWVVLPFGAATGVAAAIVAVTEWENHSWTITGRQSREHS